MKTIGILAAGVMLGVAGFLVLIMSGVRNVAALAPRSAPAAWVLDVIRDHSVRARADEIAPPFLGQFDKGDGFLVYDGLCVLCHGAPGVSASEVGLGLGPEPPPLSSRVDRWQDQELFWIIDHGLARTGMPSFGATRADGELWSVVAFLRELPAMSPEEYLMLREGLGGGSRGQHPKEGQGQPFEPEEGIIQRQAI